MNLLAKIEADYLAAYKAKQSEKIAVLRMLKAAIKMYQIDSGKEPGDEEVMVLILRQAKQRKESISQFSLAGRNDLKEREEGELRVLEAYLPAQLTSEELAVAVDCAIQETAASGPADMGKVMQFVLSQFRGRVDGKTLSSYVRQRLTT